MNSSLTYFLAGVALSAVIIVHNLFLLRRCKRLRRGQRTWKALAEANYHESEELEAMLRRARMRETLLRRMLNRCRENRDWLITQIWGSPTIVRDFGDVYKMICDLHQEKREIENKSRALVTVIQRYDSEARALHAAVERWEAQARSNAELVMTLVGSGWYIKHEVTLENFALFVVYEIDGPRVGEGISPERALENALAVKSEAAS